MTRSARLAVFAVGVAGLATLLVWGLAGLPDFGSFSARYGRLVAAVSQSERQESQVVAGTTFDIRGFDTIGEEFILFVAAAATTVLLRGHRQEREEERATDGAEEAGQPGGDPLATDSVRAAGAVLVGPLVVLGVYVVTHGHLTPGGGFQGGVILMSALALAFLAGHVLVFRRRPLPLVELAEAVGAGGFVAIGVGGLIAGAEFLYNFVPKGTSGQLLSAGAIPLDNIAVGLEVGGAFVLILSELLEQRLLAHEPGEP